jgi:phenylpyruvate tautomerase PptA (4-oxalocrotonate tautomerase family)
VESHHDLIPLFEHDLFGKPVSTFPDHALDRAKQIAVVRQLTDLVAAAAGDESLKQRTWVLLTEAAEGGWGLWGHAHKNEEIVAAARDEISRLRGR